MKTPSLEDTDLSAEIEDKKEYEEKLEALQLRLLRQQQKCYQDKRRVIVAMEGWDASGKGGAIKRSKIRGRFW